MFTVHNIIIIFQDIEECVRQRDIETYLSTLNDSEDGLESSEEECDEEYFRRDL